MGPWGMFIERSKTYTRSKPVRLAGWSLATVVLLSATLMVDCGGRSVVTGTGEAASPTAQASAVSLLPQTAQVALMGQTQFSATVNGSCAGVSWSVNGAVGGSSIFGVITNTGLYTAPNTLPSPNTVTVTAATSTDPSQSASATVTIVNPSPMLSSISPAVVPLGSGNTTLTVNGTGFAYGSVVELGGVTLPTLYWNPTALTATIPAAQLMAAGTLPVVVTTPGPGGGTTSAVAFTVATGVFATGNPQVAMHDFATTQSASVSVEFGTDTACTSRRRIHPQVVGQSRFL